MAKDRTIGPGRPVSLNGKIMIIKGREEFV